jgi:hypothetical protein
MLRCEFLEPVALASPVYDGRAWFGGRIPLALSPNLCTISTIPSQGHKPSFAGAYGGDFDQKDAGQGSRVYLPVLVDDALSGNSARVRGRVEPSSKTSIDLRHANSWELLISPTYSRCCCTTRPPATRLFSTTLQ